MRKVLFLLLVVAVVLFVQYALSFAQTAESVDGIVSENIVVDPVEKVSSTKAIYIPHTLEVVSDPEKVVDYEARIDELNELLSKYAKMADRVTCDL